MEEFNQILFIELLGGIGDVIIALPAIHALARSHPAAQITVLTFAPGGELLETDPLIHQVIYATKGEARATLDALLERNSFNLIVSDTNYDGIADKIHHYRLQSLHQPHIVTNLWRSPPDHELVSDRFLKILLEEKLICSDAILRNVSQIHLTHIELAAAQQELGAAYRPLVFLYPDAGMAIKQWSIENFIQLGKALQQECGATIVVPIGSDEAQTDQIAHGIGGNVQIWQRGSLRHLAAAIAQADLMIAADTGSARIAAALNIPTITLFGPSWYGRYGQPAPHQNLQGFPSCPERIIQNFTQQRCWYSGECPYDWQTCLDDISPDRVLKAALPLLSSPPLPLPSPASPLSRFPAPPRLQNILVIRLDNIGDVIMTTPVLRTLRENLPDAKITLMASPAGSLVAPLMPWIDSVLTWRALWQDLGRLDFNPQREWQLINTLRSHQFDAAIILTSFSQSPHPAALICALADIPVRIGESKEYNSGILTHTISSTPDAIHQVDRNLRLIESLGFLVNDRRMALSVPQVAQKTAAQLLQGSFSSSAHGALHYILLNPWTTCQSRNYDPNRFAGAARKLSQITGWKVVVTGVEKDRDHARDLLIDLGDCAINLVGQTSLSELVALVADAKIVLTNNTSTMHIADAMGTPNVILFSGTEQESQWYPRHSPSRLLRRTTVCSPCYAFTCSYELQCLNISPDSIVTAALDLLKNQINVPLP